MITREIKSNLVLPSSEGRGKGVHVSGIIRNIALESGILKAEYADDSGLKDTREITDPVAVLRICVGFSWEEWYASNFLIKNGVAHQPGELCVDGIYMTPDGVGEELVNGRYVTRVHEVKATYKSTNTVGDLTTQWMWVTQMKCYCKGFRTQKARLHALFLCGDYARPIRPMLKIFDVEFTKAEIEDNWDLMVSYRNQRS